VIVRNFLAPQLSAIVPSVRPIRPFLGILTLPPAAPLCVARTLQPPNAAATSILPMPREYSSRGTISLLHGVSVSAGSNAEDRFAAADLEAWLRQLDIPAKKSHSALPIELLRGDSRTAERLMVKAEVSIDPQMDEEGYVIVPDGRGLAVIADTSAGVFYGLQTLKQMITGSRASATLEEAVIRDWPAMRYRGLSDNLSHGSMTALEFQERQIRTLAARKVNIYSPYFEHALHYLSNPLPGLPGGTITAADACTLVAYASPYHIIIVPEQEAFGHLHHLLTCEQYASLGIVLAPGQPGSLDLIAQWFDEIAKIFPGTFLHVGADETADLGKSHTKADAEAHGLGAGYIDFLLRIHEKVAPLHRPLLFWGDIAMNDPQQVKRLPKDMIAVAWTYTPRPDGYARWLKPYLDADKETWVAPGVSNSSRVYPDNDCALRNIQRFVSDGQAAHSIGMLNTVWNDDREGLFLDEGTALLFGASAGWQPGSSSIEHGDRTGDIDQAQREMIAAYQLIDQAKIRVSTDVLFRADPWSKDGQAMAAELRPLLSPLRLHDERAITLVAQARAAGPLRETDALDALELGARRLDFIGQNFETSDLIAHTYQQAYAAQGDPVLSKRISGMLGLISGANGLCQDMRDGYSKARLGYSQRWLTENRSYWLQNVLVRYDLATQLRVVRADQFQSAHRSWSTSPTLPVAADLRIPQEQGN
jgi:hexosaminidase